ncbi:Protein kinase domain-containing protein [Heracleum sosnowskyi]|uniref:Protein kinase domain-containing protein n=1 Tax=Heracleum sosnowskyi TaxID=360622 RepID=A0AAD8M799_9APIA|nr:Protein kinase domain-containing protein [Heracleum sosnowskyi]
MAAPSSGPSGSARRWPSPTPRSPQPPSPSPSLNSSTPTSPESQFLAQKSPNSIMKDLVNKAKDSGRNTRTRPPPQQPTLLDLITQSDTDTQFQDKLITNPNNGHHFKTYRNIGSSGGASTVCSGIYWVNDANELQTMQPYDLYVAVKVTNTGDQEERAKLADQINNTRPLDHPNLLKVKEEMLFEDKFWVVFPLMDGSLRCLLNSVFSNGIPEDFIAIVLKEVLEALAYLHQQGHLHQELNAGHIYYNCRMPAIKIGYLATIYEPKSGGDEQELPESPPLPVGNICEWAAAPEIYYSTEEYSDKSDVWLVGITALELVFGGIQVRDRRALELLIAEVTRKEKGYIGKGKAKAKAVGKFVKKLMRKVKIGKAGSGSSSMSRAFKKMLALCLTVDSQERPTAAALLQHDFFKICDGTFDVYDFRNAVESAKRERATLVGTLSGSDAVGTSSGTNAAGTSSRTNAAGTSSRTNAAATSTGTNVAGTSSGTNAAGTSSRTNAAGTSSRTNAAGTSSRTNAAATSTGTNVAGTSTGGNVAGTSGGSVAGTSAGGNVAGTSAGGSVAGTSAGGKVAGTSAGGKVAGTSAGGKVAEGAKP